MSQFTNTYLLQVTKSQQTRLQIFDNVEEGRFRRREMSKRRVSSEGIVEFSESKVKTKNPKPKRWRISFIEEKKMGLIVGDPFNWCQKPNPYLFINLNLFDSIALNSGLVGICHYKVIMFILFCICSSFKGHQEEKIQKVYIKVNETKVSILYCFSLLGSSCVNFISSFSNYSTARYHTWVETAENVTKT